MTSASDGRNPLFSEEAARRAALRALGRVAGGHVALFSLMDEHLHVVLHCEPVQAGRLTRAIVLALRPLAAEPVEPARLRPVDGRHHLESLLRYLLGQPGHHGLPVHPAVWSGSCFPDIVGARRIDGLRLQLSTVLPRLRLRQVYELVGLPVAALSPCPEGVLRGAGARRLVQAASAALCVDPALAGRTSPVVRARAAVVQLTLQAGLASSEIRYALDASRQDVQYLARRPADLADLRAVRLRLALEEEIQGHGPARRLERSPSATVGPVASLAVGAV